MEPENKAINLPNNVVDVIEYHGKELSHDLLGVTAHLHDSPSFNELKPFERANMLLAIRDVHRIWLLIS